MKPLPLLSVLSLTLAATVATTAIDDIDLSAYERVDVAIENTGSNAVTASTWQNVVSDGATAIHSNDSTQASAVTAALGVGGKSVTTLTGADIPRALKVTLTSSSGSTVKIIVTGHAKGAELFPTA